MKVMMICDYPLSASEINGGVAAAAFNLVQALLKHTSINITVIGYWHDFSGSDPVIDVQDRLTIIRLPKRKARAHLRNFRAERKLFSKFIKKERPDIIHAQSEGIYASVAVNSGCMNVYTIHGVALNEIEMQKNEIGLLSYLLRSRLIKQHHRKATNIIAINKYTENAIAGLHNARVRIIHNAVDEVFFDLQSGGNITPGRLLLVGGVRQRKDIITCLKSMALLRSRNVPFSLDIVGPNDTDLLSQVEDFIKEQNLGDYVHIHGLISAKSVENFYQQADIFVLSSIEESSPIAIVQAMAAGKPIVSTDIGGISEMVSDTKNSFLVEARDPTALADKIEQVIGDREMRQRFSKSSQEIAKADWSTESVALKTNELYKEILSEK